ncbi:MAG TPA: ubiquinol oxidase subunit II [Candidatus Paceibacterota bacterium]
MFPLLQGSGIIAREEGALIIQATFLMLIVVVPVLFLLFFFAWRYRASNTKAKYMPNWQHSKIDELIWWAVPLEIVLVIAAITWQSTHKLDPRLALASTQVPLTLEAVALPHKWLFIYPSLGIATVGQLYVPATVPLRFEVTADAPMNSLWIPALGGQIYAMTSMVNTLNLMAETPGEYPGMSANYSGEGFADMKFTTHAVSQADFASWVHTIKAADGSSLDMAHYEMLKSLGAVQPGYYAEVDKNLFASIVGQFDAGMQTMSAMHH